MDIKGLEYLNDIDTKILLYLNSKNTPLWDEIMLKATDRFFWIPFYILIAFFLIWKFKKKAWILVSVIPLLMISADQLSSSVMKPLFERLRPCHAQELIGYLRNINGCGSLYGFVSSHATNTFALSTFLFLLLRKKYKSIPLIYLWALLVSYSRIYLGVHYPGDVLGGAFIGSSLGLLFYKIYTIADRRFFTETVND